MENHPCFCLIFFSVSVLSFLFFFIYLTTFLHHCLIKKNATAQGKIKNQYCIEILTKEKVQRKIR